MDKVKIDIVNKSGNKLPEYKTPQSSGCDLHAKLESPKLLQSLDRVVIPTGISFSLPDGYEAQVRPRSGMCANHGIVCMLGTIDADYRGDIGLIVINLSREPYVIQPNERLGQLVISKTIQAEWNEVETLDETERGTNGFGSTGK